MQTRKLNQLWVIILDLIQIIQLDLRQIPSQDPKAIRKLLLDPG